ncbi:MAG TPA: porin [Micropepsaceae bacterium]|nr:porin [Micropepsaceae bacterium]
MVHHKNLRVIFLAVAAAGALFPAFDTRAAEDSGDIRQALALDPPEFDIGDITVKLGGFAGGVLFDAHQSGGPGFPGGYDIARTGGEGRAHILAQHIFDNGLILGAGGNFLLFHDSLSGDQYGNDFVEKAFVFAQTGFGRVEIGEQDGAGFTLGMTGPTTNDEVTLENRKISLFRDPITGENFARVFELVATVQSTENFAKINYMTPRLFGIQIGASFTPETVRTPLPFTGNPVSDADQQHNIWEVAASYTGYVSNFALGLSAGYAQGSLKNGTPGADNLYDWALGAQLAYMLSDVKLSVGAAYRESNTYLLQIDSALAHGGTHATHLSATAEWNRWIAGVEYSLAEVTGPTDYDIHGYQISAGYKVNDNLQITGGWQWYDYRRNLGTFYNGLPRIEMNAGFLAFTYEL